MKTVKDILAGKPAGVITITPDQTLQAASQVLAQHNIGALVVVEDDQPAGILSERDIVRHLANQGEAALQLPVADAMTEEIIIALPTDDLDYASSTMTQKRIRHLPIMDDGQLVGIISIGDVVKAQLNFYQGEARTLLQYITGGHA